jgi:hypothetical protein
VGNIIGNLFHTAKHRLDLSEHPIEGNSKLVHFVAGPFNRHAALECTFRYRLGSLPHIINTGKGSSGQEPAHEDRTKGRSCQGNTEEPYVGLKQFMKGTRREINVMDTAKKGEVKNHESNHNTACKKRRVPKGEAEGDGSAQPKNLL